MRPLTRALACVAVVVLAAPPASGAATNHGAATFVCQESAFGDDCQVSGTVRGDVLALVQGFFVVDRQSCATATGTVYIAGTSGWHEVGFTWQRTGAVLLVTMTGDLQGSGIAVTPPAPADPCGWADDPFVMTVAGH